MAAAVSRIFDSILGALDAIPRVEKKIFPLLENPKNMSLNVDDSVLWKLKQVPQCSCRLHQHHPRHHPPLSAFSSPFPYPRPRPHFHLHFDIRHLHIFNRTHTNRATHFQELLTVFSRSCSMSNEIISLYGEFAYLLDEHTRMSDFLDATHPLPDYREKIDNFRNIANTIQKCAKHTISCQMISIDTAKLNEVSLGTGMQMS